MRAIVVMFDSLNRAYLPPYRPDSGIHAPNFERLAARAVTFDRCYAGSLPCMPARRELHTARYNFLHRGWGPLEPFDDSVPAMLGRAGIATHLASDHMHYWEDGGATYHTRYGTYSLIRGQQGDPWKGRVADPETGDDLRVRRSGTWRQDRINRQYIAGHGDYPQTLTFDAGLEFVRDNRHEQNWFVQIETFDPHEPFDASERFRELYGVGTHGAMPGLDWPDYQQVIEDERVQDEVRAHYSALVSQCDDSLGRVLDAMDEHGLWDDTLLIVCTDHGFLLGEQGWWGKSTPPWFEETVHIPLFVWDPRQRSRGVRSPALVQTIDIGPTLLEFFGVPPTPQMQGDTLTAAVEQAAGFREFALFGAFGGHANVTDGRFVYLRACVDESNGPLFEHTLMPTHMRGFFPPGQLATAELHPGFAFTRGSPVLRMAGASFTGPYRFGTLLFDLENDPGQTSPLVDDEQELRMARALVALMRANEAPPSQFERLGLPEEGDVTREHLLCAAQREQALGAREPVPAESEFPQSTWSVRSRVDELLAYPPAAGILNRHCRAVSVGPFADVCGELSLYRAAAAMIGVLPWATLRTIAAELADLD
jgi:arylsulfatase A-like enzyme